MRDSFWVSSALHRFDARSRQIQDALAGIMGEIAGGVWPSYSVNALTVSCLQMYRRRVGAMAAVGYSFIRRTDWRQWRLPSTTSPGAPPSSQGGEGVKSFVVGVGEIGGQVSV